MDTRKASDKTGVKTIFLDYDGTIHNSLIIYAPAFRKAYESLVKRGIAEPREWTDSEISGWIGYNPKEMWKEVLPGIDQSIRDECSEIIGSEMARFTRLGYPELYEGALETLEYLREKGYNLVFLSNCRLRYMENHTELFKLDRYFDSMLCSEDFGYISKGEILKSVIDQFPIKMAIVGDRKQDIDAGKAAGIIAIGCTYGFGGLDELFGADLIIDDITELRDIF